MAEPVSDERLAEIRTELDYPSQYALEFDAKEMARELLTEVERLRGEHDADTEAVRGALVALDVLRVALPGPAARRVAKLHARFADRIAALNARAEEGR